MKSVLGIILLVISGQVLAGKDISTSTVNYVYQLDGDATVFEFNSSVHHACGSSLYRVRSSNVAVANRKFSLVLTAFTADKKLAFHDTQKCEGNRSVVAWIRLIK
jgi:hypothetical protein